MPTWKLLILTGYCHIGSQQGRIPHMCEWRKRGRGGTQPNDDVISPGQDIVLDPNMESACGSCSHSHMLSTYYIYLYIHQAKPHPSCLRWVEKDTRIWRTKYRTRARWLEYYQLSCGILYYMFSPLASLLPSGRHALAHSASRWEYHSLLFAQMTQHYSTTIRCFILTISVALFHMRSLGLTCYAERINKV
jgi:hypothetical protein